MPNVKSSTVPIGSPADFHGGIHASLLTDPPAGTKYRVVAPEHRFMVERSLRPFRPHRDFAVAEVLDPPPGGAVFHAVRWPVISRASWVVDLDDLSYPVLWGRCAIDPQQRRRLARGRAPLWSRTFLDRAERMLAAYTHPSCKAILFRTERGVTEAKELLHAVAAPSVMRSFLDRVHVMPGAHRALDRGEVRRKWRDDPTSVVFCGRDFYQKNGRLALEVMTALARRHPEARFHYIGDAPASDTTRRFSALPNAMLHGPLSRMRSLGVVASAHILFHPARYESFGMVFAEAMAAGAAIVTSSGPLMAHVRQLIGPEGAVFVASRGEASRAERERFSKALSDLIADRRRARVMAAANYRRATTGSVSLRRRNQLLSRIYREAEVIATEPLRIEDLAAGDEVQVCSFSERALVEDLTAFRRAVPSARMSVLLDGPVPDCLDRIATDARAARLRL